MTKIKEYEIGNIHMKFAKAVYSIVALMAFIAFSIDSNALQCLLCQIRTVGQAQIFECTLDPCCTHSAPFTFALHTPIRIKLLLITLPTDLWQIDLPMFQSFEIKMRLGQAKPTDQVWYDWELVISTKLIFELSAV